MKRLPLCSLFYYVIFVSCVAKLTAEDTGMKTHRAQRF